MKGARTRAATGVSDRHANFIVAGFPGCGTASDILHLSDIIRQRVWQISLGYELGELQIQSVLTGRSCHGSGSIERAGPWGSSHGEHTTTLGWIRRWHRCSLVSEGSTLSDSAIPRLGPPPPSPSGPEREALPNRMLAIPVREARSGTGLASDDDLYNSSVTGVGGWQKLRITQLQVDLRRDYSCNQTNLPWYRGRGGRRSCFFFF